MDDVIFCSILTDKLRQQNVMYPAVMPSTLGSALDLTVANTQAAHDGLSIGLIWWGIGIGIAIGYFIFVYRMFRGRVQAVPAHGVGPNESGRLKGAVMAEPCSSPVLLFDLDGTLVDSVYQHVLAWHEALQSMELLLAVWRIHRRIGMSGGLLAQALGREIGRSVSHDQAEELQKRHAAADSVASTADFSDNYRRMISRTGEKAEIAAINVA